MRRRTSAGSVETRCRPIMLQIVLSGHSRSKKGRDLEPRESEWINGRIVGWLAHCSILNHVSLACDLATFRPDSHVMNAGIGRLFGEGGKEESVARAISEPAPVASHVPNRRSR